MQTVGLADPREYRLPRVAEPSSNARKHESRNPALRLVIGHFTRTLVRVVRELAPRTIFDVGCGEGYMLAALADAGIRAELSGMDMSASAIDAARQRLGSRARVDVGDARELRGRGKFDVVMMLEVLEHMDDPAPMLDVLAGLTAGHVVLSVPHEPLFRALNLLRGEHLSRLGNHPEHVQQFSRAGFLRFVERRFEIVDAPLVPPWTMVVARPR